MEEKNNNLQRDGTTKSKMILGKIIFYLCTIACCFVAYQAFKLAFNCLKEAFYSFGF